MLGQYKSQCRIVEILTASRTIPRAVDLRASGLGVDLFTSLSPPLLFFLYSYYHFFLDPSETCSNEFYSLENLYVNSRGKEVVESKGK